MKTLIAACCICIALTQQCLGDETLFTCKDAIGYGYIAEGGREKPGWSEEKTTSPNVIKLIHQQGGLYDIQTTTKLGVYSPLKHSCDIEQIFNVDILDLDQVFVVKCKESVSTYLFYTRSGVPQLLITVLSLEHAYTRAGVSVSRNCKKGE